MLFCSYSPKVKFTFKLSNLTTFLEFFSPMYHIFIIFVVMKNDRIIIREATPDDAALLGNVVVMALHADESHPLYEVFKELAARDDAQYSYNNAIVAEFDSKPAGALIGYDGARLHELRKPLCELLEKRMGSSLNIEEETSAGEYYADSLAVFPEYRGCGVGRALLAEACRRAFKAGFDKVGLLVDVTNPKAEAIYASMGFVRVNPTTFLGQPMWHMQKEK